MKRKVLLLLILSFTLFIFNLPIKAQDNSKEQEEITRAREDYLLQYNNYLSAHKKYIISKSTFKKFKTIDAQKDAIAKTKTVLEYRSEVFRMYLQLLKVVLNAQIPINVELHNSQFNKLEQIQSFLTNNKDNIQKSQNIAEVNAASKELKNKSKQINEIAYETRSILLLEKMLELEDKLIETVNQMAQSQKAQDNPEIKKGISEINMKLTSIRESINKINNIITDYQTTRKKYTSLVKSYPTIQKEARIIKNKMHGIMPLLKEVNRKINYE